VKKIILLVVLAGAGAFAYYKYQPSDAEDKATITRAPVTTGSINQTVVSIGTLQPIRSTRVGSQVSGRVTAIFADFNSVVKEGDVLATIDSSLFESQVAVQEANIARLDTDLAQQRVTLANDERLLARTKQLFENNLATRQQLETSELQVKQRRTQIAAAEKGRVQAGAQLAQAKLNVEYCTIKAPMDGVIMQRMVDPGSALQASVNSPMLFFMAADLDTLRLQAGVDEADIGRVRPGMPVTFTVESHRGRVFRGTVESVRLNAQNNNAVVTYPVWIEVPNPDMALKPSMTANLQIIIDSAENVTLVPNAALEFRTTSDVYAWLKVPQPQVTTAVRLAPPEEVAVPFTPVSRENAKMIDEMFKPFPKLITAGTVWTYDETVADPTQRLKQITVRLGITNGQRTELISGDLKPGMELVTSIEPPPSWYARSFGIFGPQGRRGGGLQKGEAEGPTRLMRGGPRGEGGQRGQPNQGGAQRGGGGGGRN
jgi:HlyD family secretion protein